MGRLLLVLRLANRDLRRHAGQAVLMLLTIAATTTTLTLGLALHGTSTDTWNLTRASSAGPDVMVQTYVSKGATDARVTELMHVPGVADASGPFPLASPVLRVRQVADPIFAEGRDETLPSVDRPFVTDGSWVRPFGVVVERGFAKALKVGPGDAITLDGEPFTVVGEAVGTARGANWRPQLIWTTRADAEHLQSVEGQKAYAVNLRLSDPNAAPAFADEYADPALFIATWQDIKGSDEKSVTVVQIVLLVGTWLLGMLSISSIAVLVGGRMVEQTRRAGLLKAVGATPWLVALVLLAENLVLALAAAAIGLVAGRLVAPALSSPGDSLLGAANAPSVTAATVLLVVGVGVAVAVFADDPARCPLGTVEYHQGSERLGTGAEAVLVADRAVGPASGAGPAGAATVGPQAAPSRPHGRQPRHHRRHDRHGPGPAQHLHRVRHGGHRGQPAGARQPAARSGEPGRARRDHRAGTAGDHQRGLHHPGHRRRRAAAVRAGAHLRGHSLADQLGPDDGTTAARAGRGPPERPGRTGAVPPGLARRGQRQHRGASGGMADRPGGRHRRGGGRTHHHSGAGGGRRSVAEVLRSE